LHFFFEQDYKQKSKYFHLYAVNVLVLLIYKEGGGFKMKLNGFKKVMCLVMVAGISVSTMVGCSKEKTPTSTDPASTAQKKPEDFKGELTFWHFNKDEGPVIADMFKAKYPNVKVDLQIISDQNQAYQNKLTSTIASGSGMPDVYCGEAAFVKRFVNSEGGFEDLSKAPYNAEELAKHMVPYTIDIGKDTKGKIKALTYQATPGGVGYKRELAKQYFGTDDPDKISEMMSTTDKLMTMAKQLKEKSGGKVKFFASRQELERLFVGSRKEGWVKNGKLNIDPAMDKYMELAKTMRDESFEAGTEQWSQPWSASIAANDVFAYAIPTWGVPWIVEANDEARKNKGEWALAKSPMPYFWGGTWIGMYSGSKNKDLSWEFIKYTVSDKDHLKDWSKKIGDFINHDELISEMANGSEVNKTFNQNLYKIFNPMLKDIKGNTFTEYDDRIQAAYDDYMATYLAGKISKDEFYKKFKEKVKSDFQEIKVD
jgi:hypothetical protein